MRPEHTVLIQRMFAIIDGRHWDDLDVVFHDEMTYERPGYATLEGRATIERFYREVRVIAGGMHQIERLMTNGSVGACWGRFVGATKSGDLVNVQFADWYEFRAGKVIARKTFFFAPLV